jgi:capsular exopolysaccharide synthesis family protein
MDIRIITKALRRWWWLIFAGTIAAAVTSYFATIQLAPTYLSRTTLFVGQALSDPNPQTTEFQTARSLAEAYSDLVLREPIMQKTLDALKLDWNWESLRERVTARVPPDSSMIELTVVDTDPTRTQVFAAEISRQLILQTPAGRDSQREEDIRFTQEQLKDLRDKIAQGKIQIQDLDAQITKATSSREIGNLRLQQKSIEDQLSIWRQTYGQLQANLQQGVPNFIQVIEEPVVPTVPVGPKLLQNVLLATLIGLVTSIAIAILLEAIDDTIKGTEDARKTLGLSVLGSIASIRGADYPSKLVAARTDSNRAAEAFRVLRTNLQFSSLGQPLHTLMVTSTRPKEGKSVTTSNLATVIAQSGKRVVLVDADLRRPTQHEIFELNNEVGFTTLFLDEQTRVENVAIRVAENLAVIPSGPIPHNPSELLDSVRMTHLIDKLKSRCDVVVFDVPPVLSVADATILAARVDGVLMVVDSNFTRRGQAKRAKDALTAVGARILGVVVNRVSASSEEDYYYEYASKKDGTVVKRRKRGMAGWFGAKSSSNGSSPKPVKLSKPVGQQNKVPTNGHGDKEKSK